MNLARIIPVLNIVSNQLVKTVQFKRPKYIGDPINAIKIFNDKEVDELIILDIRATADKREPNYKLIHEMASESFMPVGYGGGISSVQIADKVFQCGIEKIVINTAAFKNPAMISQLAAHYGAQSIVVCLDYRNRLFKGNSVSHSSGNEFEKGKLTDWAREMENLGAGEIILQCIDKDGTFEGYDFETLKIVSSAVTIPIVVCGGARGAVDFHKGVDQFGASAVAAGSHFVFKNNNRNSILINYNKHR